MAMDSVRTHLVRRNARQLLLLTPPFDRASPDPGYIRGYAPGLRENGGQYTHAAIWTVMAHARLGRGDEAMEMFHLINPANNTRTAAAVERYGAEPYVVAADVYAEEAHTGRGGWTWYTGSAGWLYRACLEWILGFRLRANQLLLAPCVPAEWPGFTIRYLHRGTPWVITVDRQPGTKALLQLTIDGQVQKPGRNTVDLVADGAIHDVDVQWFVAGAAEDVAASLV